MDPRALDTRILAVAEDCVAGFHRRPFAAVSAACGVDEDVVVARLLAMLREGRVRRVRQTLLSTSLAQGALVAWNVPPDALDAAFDWLLAHDPFTGHIVVRRADPPTAPGAEFRLWTTLKVPSGYGSVQEHCGILARHIHARDWVAMPVAGMFTLGVGHTRRARLQPGERLPQPPRMQVPHRPQLDAADWRVLLSLKESLQPGEFVSCPWEARAAAIGMDAEEYCRIAESLDARGVIGRFAVFLEHRGAADERTGTGHAALFHWAVPQGMEERAGAAIGSHLCMTHCYWRTGGEKAFGGAQIMGVAHAASAESLRAHKAAMDAFLASQGIPLLHTAAFLSGRAEIRPSEISPAAYKLWRDHWA